MQAKESEVTIHAWIFKAFYQFPDTDSLCSALGFHIFWTNRNLSPPSNLAILGYFRLMSKGEQSSLPKIGSPRGTANIVIWQTITSCSSEVPQNFGPIYRFWLVHNQYTIITLTSISQWQQFLTSFFWHH